jgi:hypothetical protein
LVLSSAIPYHGRATWRQARQASEQATHDRPLFDTEEGAKGSLLVSGQHPPRQHPAQCRARLVIPLLVSYSLDLV